MLAQTGAGPARLAPSQRGRFSSRLQPAVPQAQRARGSRQPARVVQTKAVQAPPSPNAAASSPPSRCTEQAITDYKSFYCNVPEEASGWIDPSDIEGTIPAELHGTLLRNGPGLCEVGGVRVHPIDGDGMVTRLSLSGGRAHFSNRIVRTEGFLKEQAAGRPLFRGSFSTDNPTGKLLDFDFSSKNTANTSVVAWAGKVLALWEGGPPHELDQFTLETKGPTLLNGAIPQGYPFAAHYRIIEDPKTRRQVLCNFGATIADGGLTFWEFDETGAVIHKSTTKIPNGAFAFFHDYLVTENYYVLFQNPLTVQLPSVLGFILYRNSAAQLMSFDRTRPMVVHLIPRRGDPDAGRRSFEVPPATFNFHHCNAYETADGKVVADSVAWRNMNFDVNPYDVTASFYDGRGKDPATLVRSELFRYELDLKTGKARRFQLNGRVCELPHVNPRFLSRRHSHVYAPASAMDDPEQGGPTQSLLKVTVSPEGIATSEAWFAGERRFVLEPTFVPRKGAVAEDDGWLLFLVNDAGAQRTDLVIMDAQQISAGPVATVHLKFKIPSGFHGMWTDELLVPQSEL